jgi:hypothetical protein
VPRQPLQAGSKETQENPQQEPNTSQIQTATATLIFLVYIFNSHKIKIILLAERSSENTQLR